LAALEPGELVAHETELRARLVEGLEAIDGVRVVRAWADAVDPVGVVTFSVDGSDAGLVAAYLSAEHGIGVRDGRFCAHPLLARLGFPAGAIRASIGVGTTGEEIERLITALRTWVSEGAKARYEVVDGCWVVSDDPRPLLQVAGLSGLFATAAAGNITAAVGCGPAPA
ncbi:cysteine desulfurase, partial [Actinotalea fermentans ATCC 43279 = JCM 9966 = DSM 3133]